MSVSNFKPTVIPDTHQQQHEHEPEHDAAGVVPEYTPEDMNQVIFNPHQENGEGPTVHVAKRSKLVRWITIDPEVETVAAMVLPTAIAQQTKQQQDSNDDDAVAEHVADNGDGQ